MGNNIKSAKSSLNVSKKSVPKGEDIMTYFENIKKTVESQNGNQSASRSTFFKKILPTSLTQFGFITSNKVNKVDSYIKSPLYLQRYKLLKLKAQNIFKKYYSQTDNTEEGNLHKKIFSIKNPFSLARDLTRKKIRRFLLYFIAFMACYMLVKYAKYKLFYKGDDKNLSEMLRLVNDLRKQNAELIKHNKELVDKILKQR